MFPLFHCSFRRLQVKYLEKHGSATPLTAAASISNPFALKLEGPVHQVGYFSRTLYYRVSASVSCWYSSYFLSNASWTLPIWRKWLVQLLLVHDSSWIALVRILVQSHSLNKSTFTAFSRPSKAERIRCCWPRNWSNTLPSTKMCWVCRYLIDEWQLYSSLLHHASLPFFSRSFFTESYCVTCLPMYLTIS